VVLRHSVRNTGSRPKNPRPRGYHPSSHGYRHIGLGRTSQAAGEEEGDSATNETEDVAAEDLRGRKRGKTTEIYQGSADEKVAARQ
jgi:hypothetical protein